VATQPNTQNQKRLQLAVELRGCCRKVQGRRQFKWKARRTYYIRALVKEGGGGEYLDVGMRTGRKEWFPIPLSAFAKPGNHIALPGPPGMPAGLTQGTALKCGAPVCEYRYNNIPGASIQSLTSSPQYPMSPSKMIPVRRGTFSMSTKGDNFGVMMEGFYLAPVTGTYTFSTRSDDASVVYVATQPNTQQGLIKVVELTGCCRKVMGTRKVLWQQGGKYYIRAAVKEQQGGEYLYVGTTVTTGPPPAKLLSSQCQDGDVRVAPGTTIGEGTDMYPEVSYKGKWYPICGHYFWDNDDGATSFCKRLGFTKGTRGKRGGKFNIDAMPVGKCKAGQRLNQCNAGGHAWGNFNYNNGWCKKGKNIALAIKCIGGTSTSCGTQAPASASTCTDGDVRVSPGTTIGAGKDMYPEVSYMGRWYPICGHYFWDNSHGATMFCKQLGFRSGVLGKRGANFNIDAMPVGKCRPGQHFNQCNAGGHAWGNFNYRGGWCKKGRQYGGRGVGVAIKCIGGKIQSCGAQAQLATKCANEHQSCKCNGMVAYGHHDHRGNPVWSKWKSVRGSIGCTNAVFGDPGVGTFKYCVCHTGSVSACKDGDVRVAAGTTIGEGTDMYPEVSYKGKWYPICGHYFWDNNDGATSFCKQLGFSSGVRGKRGGTFNIDAMPVGKCKAGQRLNQCNAGGHAWGNFNYNNGWCKKGKNIAVAIKCVGGMTSSCNKLSQLKPVVTEYFPIPITQFRLGEGALTGGPASAPGMTTGIALRCGAAVCEYQYTGIGGTKVPDLLRSPKFPRHPSKIIKLTHGTFSMTMKGNNLGVMMEGFVRAPVTGAYSFSTRSDDSSAVWAAQQPNTQLGLTKVVELNGCCRKVQGKVKLQWVAGQAYYIRAYVKEGGGGEYGQIGMRMGNQEWFPIPITAFVKLGSQTAAKGPSIGVRLKCGAAVCEYQYKGIGGTNVRDLTRAKNFPSKPDKIVQITTGTFSMTMKGNNLGVMMEGFVRAPITGEYTFSTRSDDSSEVWVAQKPMTQSGLTKVVELRGCCRKVQGRKKVSWKVGMPYYIRAYVKEGGGVEYGQVGMTVEGREWFPIPISAFVKL
jgi:hypothetical protein